MRWSHREGPLIKRILSIMGFLLLLLVVVGFGYERIARRDDAQQYPPPGALIRVNDHRLQLVCAGAGSPTVVLEAGLGESGLGWATVQRNVAEETRVCAYDRAGLAWSEPTSEAPTAEYTAYALRELLRGAGENGPYLLVAHSFGAMSALLFATEYREEMTGLVLIDPTNQEAVLATGEPTLPIIERRLYGFAAEIGFLRLFGRSLLAGESPPPAEVLEAIPIIYGAGSHAATIRELQASLESARQVQASIGSGVWGELPLVVISAADTKTAERAHHEALAGLSTVGLHLVAESGGHYVHYEHPDFVAEQVLRLVD